jgi:hypothetical protein
VSIPDMAQPKSEAERDVAVRRDGTQKGRSTAALSVELPGIEPGALPGLCHLSCRFVPVRYGSVPLVTCGFVLGS